MIKIQYNKLYTDGIMKGETITDTITCTVDRYNELVSSIGDEWLCGGDRYKVTDVKIINQLGTAIS